MPCTSTSICSSVSSPPIALPKPGIPVPGTPFAMIFRIVSFGITCRYSGSCIEIEALMVSPLLWHPKQFLAYRSAKFLLASGGFHLFFLFGFPGNWSQPVSAKTRSEEKVKTTQFVTSRAQKIVCAFFNDSNRAFSAFRHKTGRGILFILIAMDSVHAQTICH
jgi:hypothetical protein